MILIIILKIIFYKPPHTVLAVSPETSTESAIEAYRTYCEPVRDLLKNVRINELNRTY